MDIVKSAEKMAKDLLESLHGPRKVHLNRTIISLLKWQTQADFDLVGDDYDMSFSEHNQLVDTVKDRLDDYGISAKVVYGKADEYFKFIIENNYQNNGKARSSFGARLAEDTEGK
ncbi:MAG: hypothetical protein JW745_00680 [Sedimentisphaerales bacterium]|nr:hypothetical protein [Sedimentisphaerales bacterium]